MSRNHVEVAEALEEWHMVRVCTEAVCFGIVPDCSMVRADVGTGDHAAQRNDVEASWDRIGDGQEIG